MPLIDPTAAAPEPREAGVDGAVVDSDPAAETASGRGRVLRFLLTIVVVSLAVGLLYSGALGDPEETVAAVRGAGALGVVAYLALFSFAQPLGVSGHFFTLCAAAIWPLPVAFGLALLGSLGSASTSFAFARYVAFDWVQARIPRRVRRLEKWLVARGLYGVIVYRLLTFTMPPAQLLIGTARVRYPTMLLGTAIGFCPMIAIDVFLGGELFAWLIA